MRTSVIRLSHHRWLLWPALALCFLALSVSYYRKVSDAPDGHRSAIYRWQNQLLDLAQGIDIWEAHHYPNPPIMALLLLPLAQLPFQISAMTWFYSKSIMALLTLLWTFRLLERAGKPFPLPGKIVVVVLGLRLLAGDLMHGNVNLLVFFLVVAFVYVFVRRHDFKSGLILALAVACKVTPALFIPFLVWKRAWRTLTGVALGLVLFLWIVPGLYLGMAHNARCLQSWAEAMMYPYLLEGKVTTEYANQSLPGLIYRLASDSPSFVLETYAEVIPVEYHNCIDVDRQVLGWFSRGCLLLYAALVLCSCRHSIATRAGAPILAECGIVLIGMLLFSERTWKHHCATMLVPLAVLCYVLFTCQPRKRLRWYLVSTLAVVFLLMTATSSGLFPGHDRLGRLAQVYGAYVWANLLLLTALSVILLDKMTLAELAGARQPRRTGVKSQIEDGVDGEISVDLQRRHGRLPDEGTRPLEGSPGGGRFLGALVWAVSRPGAGARESD